MRFGEYVVTAHALDAMEDDALTVFDLERCVLTGAVVERQRDRARREWRYLVAGYAIDDSPTMVIGKIGRTGRLVIVTVYLRHQGG